MTRTLILYVFRLCFHGVTEEREGSKPLLWMKLLQLSLGFYEIRCNVYRLTTLSYLYTTH